MRVFVTGATGFIGSATVKELIAAGHNVLGLSRSDEGAKALVAAGAEVHRGHLEDLDSLRSGAAACDGVIHLAFIHDFSKYAENGEIDRIAIGALGDALADSGRPLVVTSGTAFLAPGRVATEDDTVPADSGFPRVSEQAGFATVARGVRATAIRLPPSVHGDGDKGFVPMLIATAREKGVSAYIGDGANRWPAVHRFDAAHLYRLVLEKGVAGARYHGIGDEGIAFRDIAAAIGRGLNLPVISVTPEQAGGHFGWFGLFAGIDSPASAAQTRKSLGWEPMQIGLIADLAGPSYFKT